MVVRPFGSTGLNGGSILYVNGKAVAARAGNYTVDSNQWLVVGSDTGDGPEVAVPELTLQGEDLRNWWIHSWEPSYREIAIDDFRSVDDLLDIVYDSAMQLGAGSVQRFDGGVDSGVRRESLATLAALEPRLRQAADALVEEVLRGWHRFRGDGRRP